MKMNSFICQNNYGDVSLLNIYAEKVQNWDSGNATHIRVSIPAKLDDMLQMHENGFQFADRMLDVAIHPARTNIDYKKLIRMKPIFTSGYREEIKQIAKASFIGDSRFYVSKHNRTEIANKILESWIDEEEFFYVCRYRDQVAGFLILKELEAGKSTSIHLAAVDDKFRSAGIAMSLYANAVLEGTRLGYRRIEGKISSLNMPVMNLYSFLGGTFANPADIYLKEVTE